MFHDYQLQDIQHFLTINQWVKNNLHILIYSGTELDWQLFHNGWSTKWLFLFFICILSKFPFLIQSWKQEHISIGNWFNWKSVLVNSDIITEISITMHNCMKICKWVTSKHCLNVICSTHCRLHYSFGQINWIERALYSPE